MNYIATYWDPYVFINQSNLITITTIQADCDEYLSFHNRLIHLKSVDLNPYLYQVSSTIKKLLPENSIIFQTNRIQKKFSWKRIGLFALSFATLIIPLFTLVVKTYYKFFVIFPIKKFTVDALLEEVDKHLKTDTNQADLLAFKALLSFYQEKQNPSCMIECLERALQANPKHPHTFFLIEEWLKLSIRKDLAYDLLILKAQSLPVEEIDEKIYALTIVLTDEPNHQKAKNLLEEQLRLVLDIKQKTQLLILKAQTQAKTDLIDTLTTLNELIQIFPYQENIHQLILKLSPVFKNNFDFKLLKIRSYRQMHNMEKTIKSIQNRLKQTDYRIELRMLIEKFLNGQFLDEDKKKRFAFFEISDKLNLRFLQAHCFRREKNFSTALEIYKDIFEINPCYPLFLDCQELISDYFEHTNLTDADTRVFFLIGESLVKMAQEHKDFNLNLYALIFLKHYYQANQQDWREVPFVLTTLQSLDSYKKTLDLTQTELFLLQNLKSYFAPHLISVDAQRSETIAITMPDFSNQPSEENKTKYHSWRITRISLNFLNPFSNQTSDQDKKSENLLQPFKHPSDLFNVETVDFLKKQALKFI